MVLKISGIQSESVADKGEGRLLLPSGYLKICSLCLSGFDG